MKKLKLLLALSLAGLLIYSCQYEDEVMLQNSNTNQLLLHRDVEKSIVKVSELFKNDNFKKSFEKIRKIKTKNTPFGINSRSAMEDQYGFTITNPDATVLTTSSIKSYTIHITPDEGINDTKFQNLVIEIDNQGKSTATILEYQIENPIQGVAVSNLTPILKEVLFDDLNKISFELSLAFGCTILTIYECNNPNATHEPGQDGCSAIGESYPLCGGYDDLPGAPEVGTGLPVGGDSSDGGSPSSITTTPVTENLEPFSNICDELAKKDALQAFKDKLYTELKNKAATQNFESAYVLYNNAVEGLTFSNEFVGDPNDRQGGQVNIDIGGLPTQSTVNCVGFIHCHLNNGSTYKIFSIGDLIALAQIATLSSNSGKEFAIYVITSSGTFAITVNDKLLLKSKLEELRDNIKDYEPIFDVFVNKNSTVDSQKKGFLKFLKASSADLGGLGINLNQKNAATGKWEQLTLSSNGTDVLTNSCN